MRDLAHTLERIDGRGYKAYKDLQGRRYHFAEFDLLVDHVQGDAYAAPSRFRALMPVDEAALPSSALASPARSRASRDFLARAFRTAACAQQEISIDAGAQTVLDRSACLIDAEFVELRFTVDLPAAGRRILGRKAGSLLLDHLPCIVRAAALADQLDLGAIERHAATLVVAP